jgi:hypothetical protein
MSEAKGQRDRLFLSLRVEQGLEATVTVALKDACEPGQMLLRMLAASVARGVIDRRRRRRSGEGAIVAHIMRWTVPATVRLQREEDSHDTHDDRSRYLEKLVSDPRGHRRWRDHSPKTGPRKSSRFLFTAPRLCRRSRSLRQCSSLGPEKSFSTRRPTAHAYSQSDAARSQKKHRSLQLLRLRPRRCEQKIRGLWALFASRRPAGENNEWNRSEACKLTQFNPCEGIARTRRTTSGSLLASKYGGASIFNTSVRAPRLPAIPARAACTAPGSSVVAQPFFTKEHSLCASGRNAWSPGIVLTSL